MLPHSPYQRGDGLVQMIHWVMPGFTFEPLAESSVFKPGCDIAEWLT